MGKKNSGTEKAKDLLIEKFPLIVIGNLEKDSSLSKKQKETLIKNLAKTVEGQCAIVVYGEKIKEMFSSSKQVVGKRVQKILESLQN